MSGSLIGLDIGGSSIKGVRMRDGAVVAEAISREYARPSAECLREAITQVVGALGAAGDVGVGVCVPGILNEARTRIVQAVNLPGLVGLDLEGTLRSALPGATGVRIVSDAFASAFGYWAEHRRPGRLLALVIGTGVGACVLDDGVPLTVVDECPGHLGQMDVGVIGASGAPIGPDAGAGSLEAYIGAAALERRFGAARLAGWLGAPDDDPAFVALARAIRICHALFRPSEVVLLGGVGTRLEPRLGTLDRLVRAGLTSIARPSWRLACGRSDRYGATGAALQCAPTVR